MPCIPRAPSWPIVIISGLVGGVVNWRFQSEALAMGTFAVVGSILIVLSGRRHGRR